MQANGFLLKKEVAGSGGDGETSTISAPADTSKKRKILRAAATLPIVIFCGLAFGYTAGILLVALLSPQAPVTRDYFFYWSTARQLTHHANPYDAQAMSDFEHSAGLSTAYQAGLMRNPPWALPLIYPLGFLSPRAGWILWYFLLLASLALSVYLLWNLCGRLRSERYLLGLFCSGADLHDLRANLTAGGSWAGSFSLPAPHAPVYWPAPRFRCAR